MPYQAEAKDEEAFPRPRPGLRRAPLRARRARVHRLARHQQRTSDQPVPDCTLASSRSLVATQDTAAFWAQKGQIEKPVKADGILDLFGLGPTSKTAKGTSGANQEIGAGLYVTDDQFMYVPTPLLSSGRMR